MYCSKCGNQNSDDSLFCSKCGNQVRNGAKIKNNVANLSDEFDSQSEYEESGFSVLQFIRGIPLGLVFVAFVLPLFVISCPKLDTVIGEFSAYQSLDLTTAMAKLLSQLPANEINDVKEALGNFSIAVFSVLVISALSFGFSFFQRLLAAILGIVALVDFSVILVILVGKSNEMISIYPGSGGLLSIGLFIVAIVMCFIPCKRERSLPLIAKIALVFVPVGIVFVCAFPGIGASNSFKDGNGSEPVVKLPRAEVNEAMFERLSRETPSVEELSQFTSAELRILRNSIFARHGYKFKSADLREYFSRYSWYEARYADVLKLLNSVEKKNIDLLKAMEDSDGNVFIDARDGKTYKTVTIGTQVWMAENLNYKVNDSWCYANESGNCNKYGRLYKLSAARQACPAGWHLPRYKEWQKLSDFVDKNKGGLEFDATLMSKTGWTNDFGLPKGVDSFGFKALPAGMGDASFSEGLNMLAMFRAYETGKFYLIGYGDLGDEDGSVYDSTGLSVRCIKDK